MSERIPSRFNIHGGPTAYAQSHPRPRSNFRLGVGEITTTPAHSRRWNATPLCCRSSIRFFRRPKRALPGGMRQTRYCFTWRRSCRSLLSLLIPVGVPLRILVSGSSFQGPRCGTPGASARVDYCAGLDQESRGLSKGLERNWHGDIPTPQVRTWPDWD